MIFSIFIFFLITLNHYSLLGGEGHIVGQTIFYEQPGHNVHHEGSELIIHEHQDHHAGAEDPTELEEEHHHHHHASHTHNTNTTAPVITSLPQQIGGTTLSLSQEAGLIKNPSASTDKPKQVISDSYRYNPISLSSGDIVFLGIDNVVVEQDPVTRFFKTDIWTDITFHKDLLEEYKQFFEREMNQISQINSTLKKKKLKTGESVVTTQLFQSALEKFKESSEGVELQNQLESYISTFNRFIASQKSIKKSKISQSKKFKALEIKKIEDFAFQSGEDTPYVLTYNGDTEAPTPVTEKSMRLLFGQSFFTKFLTEQIFKNPTIFIPYRSLLEIFNNKDRLFYISLLRSKIYFAESNDSVKL